MLGNSCPYWAILIDWEMANCDPKYSLEEEEELREV
jgi:hypothetical protein